MQGFAKRANACNKNNHQIIIIIKKIIIHYYFNLLFELIFDIAIAKTELDDM